MTHAQRQKLQTHACASTYHHHRDDVRTTLPSRTSHPMGLGATKSRPRCISTRPPRSAHAHSNKRREENFHATGARKVAACRHQRQVLPRLTPRLSEGPGRKKSKASSSNKHPLTAGKVVRGTKRCPRVSGETITAPPRNGAPAASGPPPGGGRSRLGWEEASAAARRGEGPTDGVAKGVQIVGSTRGSLRKPVSQSGGGGGQGLLLDVHDAAAITQ